MIAIVVRALGTILPAWERGLKKLEIRGKIETTQTVVLLRAAKIQRKVIENGRDLESLRL